MRITFKGRPKNKNVSITRCREAATFFANTLMSKRLRRNLEIEITFKDIERSFPGDKTLATCTNLDYEQNPKYFEIEIQEDVGLRTALFAIAHEMVHVEQKATGRWYEYVKDDTMHRWEQTPVKVKSDDEDYWDRPWEIEAYGKEKGLYVKYRRYHESRSKNHR